MKKSIAAITSLVLIGGSTVGLAGSAQDTEEKPVALQEPRKVSHTSRSEVRDLVVDKRIMQAAIMRAKAVAEKRRVAKIAARKAAAEIAAEKAEKARQVKRKRQEYRAASPKTTVNSGSPKQYALSRLGSAQFSCFNNIVNHESGWRHTASNPSSGAYGLVQALPGSKMASAGADWKTNPITQIKWGISYMNGRYGSPCGAWSFWQRNSWY